MPGFNVDEAPTDASYTAELFARVRSNGRILDDFKCVLGGTDCLEVEFSLSKIFEDSSLASRDAGVSANKFLRLLEQSKAQASARWAVILGDNEKLTLQLQGLPAAAAVLNGKPSFKR